ncbi:hypothetical protein [Candidatus Nitrososphaera sp. FF02]|uniref:hypothetical protein n=1 Tax=Candidatus Nitrososphaera sp. FF02 TaxID=3398226 RepID=UPI0039ECBE17
MSLMFSPLPKEVPLFELFARNMSFPSSHTTYTLLPATAMLGDANTLPVLLRLIGGSNEAPPSVLTEIAMSLISTQATYTLAPEAAIAGKFEVSPGLLLKFTGRPNDTPSLPLIVKDISRVGSSVSSSHTTYTLLPDARYLGVHGKPGIVADVECGIKRGSIVCAFSDKYIVYGRIGIVAPHYVDIAACCCNMRAG